MEPNPKLLSTIDDMIKIKQEVPAANDNTKESLAFLREAINAPDREEVVTLIKKTMLEFDVGRFIKLVTPTETIKLDEAPRHFLFDDIMQAVNAGIPAALIGPAGSGKSTLCEQVAQSLKLDFYLQNSVTGDHQLTGYLDAYGKYHGSAFRAAFEKGGFIFVDEVDTSDPSALKWMNTAIANGYAMFPDSEVPVRVHKNFRIAIAANTFGNGADRVYVGANQLDASTLDRFVFFDFRYDEKMERLLAGNNDWTTRVQKLRKAAGVEKARMVISPRASINGAKLLSMGWDKKKVEDRVIWKNTDEELRARIEKKAA